MSMTVSTAALPITNPSSTASALPATAAATPNSTNTVPATGLNQLDNSQTFLQLLVAQLKNQDPTNPADPSQFMTEIAQMTAVQSQTSLDAEEQTVAADSMIGKTITGVSSTGAQASGLVSSVLLSASGSPQLEIGSGSTAQIVPLTSITQVAAAYAAPPA